MWKTGAVLLLLVAGPAMAGELVGPPPPEDWESRSNAYVKQEMERQRHEAKREANQLCVASAADLGLTEVVLARGGAESNPLVRNRGIRISLSAAACAWAQIEARGNHPRPAQLRKAKWARLAFVAINIVVLAR